MLRKKNYAAGLHREFLSISGYDRRRCAIFFRRTAPFPTSKKNLFRHKSAWNGGWPVHVHPVGSYGALCWEFSKGITFFRPTKKIILREPPNVGGLKIRARSSWTGVPVGTVQTSGLRPQGTKRQPFGYENLLPIRKFIKIARIALDTYGFLR